MSRSIPVLLMVVFLAHVSPSAQTPVVEYVYDELNRLVAVIAPSGEAAVYQYDAVGNLLSITRHPAGAVSLIEFTPDRGPVGTTVTIDGTGFSGTPASNTVTIGGTAATVSSATATRLVTTVPAGASTGPIAVTSPGGSATSSASFTVTATNGAPTITEVVPPVGLAGTAMTITGTNFEPMPLNNNVLFNLLKPVAVGSATSTSLATTVATGATSGRLWVGTPNGSAFAEFFVPPPGFTAADVLVTGRLTPTETRPVSIATAQKIALFVIEGGPGKRVSLDITNSTVPSYYAFYTPGGTAFSTWSKIHRSDVGSRRRSLQTRRRGTIRSDPVTRELFYDPLDSNVTTALSTISPYSSRSNSPRFLRFRSSASVRAERH